MQRYTFTPLSAADQLYSPAQNLQNNGRRVRAEVAYNAERTDRLGSRAPQMARLTEPVRVDNGAYAGLAFTSGNRVRDALTTVAQNRNAALLAAQLDQHSTKHRASGRSGRHVIKKGVQIEFRPAEPRSFGQGLAHLGHDHLLPGAEALLVLAGSHDNPTVFTSLLFNDAATSDDALKEVCHELQRGAFIALRCLRQSVHDAAVKGVAVQSRDSLETNAGPVMYRAHRVVAAFLVGLREAQLETGHAADAFRLVMDSLRERPYMQVHDQSAYAGIVTGICLAGVMRFFKDELERGTKKQNRLQFALAALGTGVSLAPLAGPAVGGIINLLAEPIAKAAFKTRDMSEAVVRLGAGIEDEMRSRPPAGVDWREFNLQLEKTMRHCGFSY